MISLSVNLIVSEIGLVKLGMLNCVRFFSFKKADATKMSKPYKDIGLTMIHVAT